METTQLTPEAPVQPETPERRSAAPRFQLPKKRRKWLKRLVLILAAAGILFLLLRPLLFGSPAASSGQYQPAAVQRQDLTVSVDGSAAETALQNAALSLQNAQLSLQSAQEVLENYTITSPISGTVIEKNLKAGDQLDGSESGALAVIYDLEQLELKMNVSELDIGKIRPGQSVEITAEALPGETFLGTVEKVNINGTTTDGFTTYPVTILLSEYGALNPGMNVSADIIVEQAQQALCIPTPAVSGGNTVLVAPDGALGEDGSVLDPAKLETRQVELGRSSQDYVEILSGLEEGETVLVPIQSADGSAGSTAVMASGG